MDRELNTVNEKAKQMSGRRVFQAEGIVGKKGPEMECYWRILSRGVM